MAEELDSRAGRPAQPSDLVDIARLVTAYYVDHPDVSQPEERVAFGTSGHRGSSLANTFNEDHIVATSQAICEYRRQNGIDGPLFLGADSHALSEPATASALEVFTANDVTVLVDKRDGYTPTPALSRAILVYNASGPAHRADGVVVTPSHNPPVGRRIQVQPAGRRPGGHRHHQVDREPGERTARARSQGGAAHPVPAGARHRSRLRLPRLLRHVAAARRRPRRDPIGGRAHRRRPAGRRVGRVLGRDRRAVRARPHRRQSRGGQDLPLHDARLGRQDPHGLLVAVGDGVADRAPARLRHRDRQRHRLRPARHRHAGRRADEPEPLPRRRHRVPVREPAELAGRCRRREDAGQFHDDRPGSGVPRPEAARGAGRVQVVRARVCSTARSRSAARRARARPSSSATARCGRPTRTASSSACSRQKSLR